MRGASLKVLDWIGAHVCQNRILFGAVLAVIHVVRSYFNNAAIQ